WFDCVVCGEEAVGLVPGLLGELRQLGAEVDVDLPAGGAVLGGDEVVVDAPEPLGRVRAVGVGRPEGETVGVGRLGVEPEGAGREDRQSGTIPSAALQVSASIGSVGLFLGGQAGP